MNYIKIHDSIINNAKSREKSIDTYYERHHILPRCMGGLDEDSNLVYLTAREHFLIHWLLVEIHRESKYYYKLVNAWNKMCSFSKRHEARITSSRYFKYAREEFSLSRLRNDFNDEVVIYDEVNKSIKYEGPFRKCGFNPSNYCQEYRNFLKRNTAKQGRFQYCTYFIKSYFYENETEIRSTKRNPINLSRINRNSNYPDMDVNLVKDNFICKISLKSLGPNYTRNYERARDNYLFTKGIKKGVTLELA